jgi:Response regulator containing CheY-like receiver domain and AraC-type DNA-binding domain
VLIVEDELLVRLGLKNSINWAKFDMTVIADEPDGLSALRAYECEKPDLILTDLKMPVMGGMEFISKIRENDSVTRIVILSCLEEFDIARKAMAMGVSNYILKLTMTWEEIEKVLQIEKGELDKMNVFRDQNNKVTELTGILKENAFKNYLNENIGDIDFIKKIKELNFRLSSERLVVCLMEIDYYQKFITSSSKEIGQSAHAMIFNTAKELIDEYNRGEIFQENEKRFILIFSFSDIFSEKSIVEELNTMVKHIRSVIKNFFNITISMGISSIKSGYTSLKQLYAESEKALELKYYDGVSKTFYWNDGIQKQYKSQALQKIMEMQSVFFEGSMLNDIQMQHFKEKLDKLYKQGFEFKEEIIEVFFQLMFWNSADISYSGMDLSSMLIYYQDSLKECETIEELFEVYKAYSSEINEIVHNKRSISRDVSEAIKYMKLFYEKDLSLQKVADVVGLSPGYLSSLFKKELDLNFIDYLNYIRIQKAKELLLGTNMKSYEIAEKIGFTDGSYFSRTFKKITGVRPNDFRRKLVSPLIEDEDDENI